MVRLAEYLSPKSGKGMLPEGVTWGQVVGAGCLAGIGFTMSLFISVLAFDDPTLITAAKIGIIFASLTSGILGVVILSRSLPKADQ